jgi:hypothetical protein
MSNQADERLWTEVLAMGGSIFDMRHRLIGGYDWEVPRAKSLKGAPGAVIGGWQIGSIVPVRSGSRCNVPRISNRDAQLWFSTNAFSPSVGAFGTAPRDPLVGPGIHTTGCVGVQVMQDAVRGIARDAVPQGVFQLAKHAATGESCRHAGHGNIRQGDRHPAGQPADPIRTETHVVMKKGDRRNFPAWMIRALSWLVCILGGAAATARAELLTGFRPATIRMDYGVASEVHFSTGLVELESGVLAHHLPQAMKEFWFAEPVWVIGYKTDLVDARGKPPRDNYLCHTFFSDQRVDQREENEIKGIYSDAFTPEVRLPAGFGIPLLAGERLHWMPMFNNRADEPARVEMKVTITLVRGKDLKKPLRPLYASLRSVETPHLFFVPPGHDERQVTFKLPFDGRIHFLGTHIHPHGVSIELYNVTRRERVWKGGRTGDSNGSMEVYSNAEGYPTSAGDMYKITAVYENPGSDKIDAMAGLFMLYSRN